MPLTTPIRLSHGVPVKVVDSATGTGVGLAQQFVLPDGCSNLLIQGVENAVTVLTASLEISLDAGVTFSAFDAAVDYAAAAIAVKRYEGLVGGHPIYRINIITFTGTDMDFWVCCYRVTD